MENTELEKQVNNKSTYNRNTLGVGGFGENNQNINRNGRPKCGLTWREILQEVGETVVSQSEYAGRTYREAVALKLWEEALKGNIQAVKLLFERMDSLPTNKYIEANLLLEAHVEKLSLLVDSILSEPD